MKRTVLAIIFLSVVGGLTCAMAVGPTPPVDPFGTLESRDEIPSEKKFRKFEGQVSLDHFLGRRGYISSYSQATFDGFYYFPKKKHTLRLIQPVQKKWEIASNGEDEFDIQDTSLYYYYELTPDFYTLQIKLRAGASLPLSRASRDTNLLTRTSAMVQFNRTFLKDTLTLGYWPFFNYYVNEYSTTRDGRNVREMAFGHWLAAIYHPIPRVEIQAALTGAYTLNYRSPYAASRGPIAGIYEWDIYAGYEVVNGVLVRVGYNHGNSFIKDGRYEVNAFDQAVSRFYIGADIAL